MMGDWKERLEPEVGYMRWSSDGIPFVVGGNQDSMVRDDGTPALMP
jgi:hypothetical protein